MFKNLRAAAPIFLLTALIINCSSIKNTKESESVIHRMHAKWNGKWPKHMKFEQNVYHYQNNQIVKEEVWQELLSCPQNLHIRFNGFDSGNGLIFRNDTIYTIIGNQIVKQERKVHHLLLLGFDVYHQSPELTETKLMELGFNLKKSYETSVDRQEVIVIGTLDKSDLNSSQFWIDKENLYLLRVILNRDSIQSDITFGNYKMLKGFPVATEITFKVNKELKMVEKYFNIKFPEDVDMKLFDPEHFKEAVW